MEKTINIRNFNTRSNQRIEIADNQENRLGQSVRICLFLLFVKLGLKVVLWYGNYYKLIIAFGISLIMIIYSLDT